MKPKLDEVQQPLAAVFVSEMTVREFYAGLILAGLVASPARAASKGLQMVGAARELADMLIHELETVHAPTT